MHQNILLRSLTAGITPLWDDWKSLVIRTYGWHGYTATCLHSWSRKNENRIKFAWSLKPLFICRSNLSWQIYVDLMQQLREKLVYWKPHDSVHRSRVSRYGLKTFFCIFWNSCGVLPDRLLEMSLMVTPEVNYHKLTQVGNQMLCSLRENIEKLLASAFARHCS